MVGLLGLLALGVLGMSFVFSSDQSVDGDGQEANDSETSETRETETDTSHLSDMVDGRSGESFNQKDWLTGGDQDDVLIAGPKDVLTGGEGHDTFNVMASDVAYVQDFEDGDTIVISYKGETPKLSFDVNDNGLTIFANEKPIVLLSEVYSLDKSTIQFSEERPR